MSEATNEHGRAAERYAAELLAETSVPTTYDEAVRVLSIAYLQGGADQLKWAQERMKL